MASNIPAQKPPKPSYSEVIATPPKQSSHTDPAQVHKPNPASFTAQTGQIFKPARERRVDESPKILITSSQEEQLPEKDTLEDVISSQAIHISENQAAPQEKEQQQTHPISTPENAPAASIEVPNTPTTGPLGKKDGQPFQCHICFRKLRNKTGLKLHIRKCKNDSRAATMPEQSRARQHPTTRQTEEAAATIPPIVPAAQTNQQETTPDDANVFEKYVDDPSQMNTMYNAIVFWRRNLFTLPSGAAGKMFIKESTRLINAWSMKSSIRPIAMKLLMMMPALLLQKTSSKSKSKDHAEALKRRMELWNSGKLDDLFFEAVSIQKRLKNTPRPTSIDSIAKRFSAHMLNGRVSAAVKLLSEQSDDGILPINEETLKLLHEKHPPAKEPGEIAMLPGEIQPVHPSVFDQINGDTIQKASSRTKGGAGPSGMNADDWSRILASNKYGQASSECREAIALFTRTICSEKTPTETTTSLEGFIACRLLPLNKNPGCRPIGIGEILRRIVSKAAMSVFTEDVIESAGCVQICAGHKGGAEAAIHAVRRIYEDNEDDAVVLIDASNAFNSLNRKAALHNIGILCPIMHTFASNLYQPQARLFVQGGAEISSSEGTTQGGPESMAIYALATVPLLRKMKSTQPAEDPARHVAYADDAVGAGKVGNLRIWWDAICEYGPHFGYFINAKKSWIIIKPHMRAETDQAFQGTGINITTDGQRHLGASLGSNKYREEFVHDLVDGWVKQIRMLAKIAKIDPHCAYTAYTHGLRHKYTYAMRTIPNIGSMLQPLENAIRNQLIPALTEQMQMSEQERSLIALPVRLGGLGIPNPCKEAQHEFENSVKLTKNLADAIINQSSAAADNTENRSLVSKANRIRQTNMKDEVEQTLPEWQKKQLQLNQQKGASSWLTALPIDEHGFHLSKRQFWDSIRLRYGWAMTNTPSSCACGKGFSVAHALSCHLGGFTSIRHNELRDLTAELLQQACHDVKIEPPLEPLTGEGFSARSANTAQEARLDVSARGLFVPYQKVFADIRVVNPTAMRYERQSPEQILESNASEKKRQYCRRVLEVENATFCPLIFTTNGGMGRECIAFYNRLAQELANKWKTAQSQTVAWMRTRLSFALCRSAHMCIRGSRKWNSKVPVDQDQVELFAR